MNELIAHMTMQPVKDHTSTNKTFSTNPLKRVLEVDISHDNDMTAIFSAMGLYHFTSPLSNVTIEGVELTDGYSAAWTVPFAARAYFEKLKCEGEEEEFVRVLVNDRVIPLREFGADERGMVSLSGFVNKLEFARSGGRWEECFA